MKLPRRTFLRLAAGAAALPAASHVARAQAYPTRPVRIIAPIAAGGTQDTMARLIGPWLADRLSQPFIIENRPGGGNNIGTEAVVRAAADGYTLLLVSTANAVNATLYENLNFNFIRDIAPVAGISRFQFVMTVHPSIPATTVPEFIAYAKANPDKINMASAGSGTVPHVAGELFKLMADIKMVHVPYRGGAPAMTDLLGGQVQVYFVTTASSVEHVRSGRLRALAVTTATRSELMPDVPSMSDFLPGYEASVWFGLGAPKGTPPEVINRLNSETNTGLADARIKARLADLGGMALAGPPADFGKLVFDDTERWRKVVEFAGVRPG